MTEIDLYIAWSKVKAQLWTQVQFMASISFGLVALAHFSADRLNLPFVVMLILAHTGLYFHGFSLIGSDIKFIQTFYGQAADLALLENSTPAIEALANYPPPAGVAIVFFGFVLPAVYFGSFFYLIYQYRQSKRVSRVSAS